MKSTLVFLLLVLIGSSEPRADVATIAEEACGGFGVRGTVRADGVPRIFFQSCATPAGAFSRIWRVGASGDGREMSRVVVAGDRMRVFLDGVELHRGTRKKEAARMMAALTTREAAVVGRHLWAGLQRAGFSRATQPAAMAALAANLAAYEVAVGETEGEDNDCLGCCGPRCYGCTGCYTRECLEHDVCVRTQDHLRCLDRLLIAAASAWKCR